MASRRGWRIELWKDGDTELVAHHLHGSGRLVLLRGRPPATYMVKEGRGRALLEADVPWRPATTTPP